AWGGGARRWRAAGRPRSPAAQSALWPSNGPIRPCTGADGGVSRATGVSSAGASAKTGSAWGKRGAALGCWKAVVPCITAVCACPRGSPWFNRDKLNHNISPGRSAATRTSGRIQTENYGFKVFAVPSTLWNGFSGHFTVQLDQICNIGSLFHGYTTYCRTRCYV